MKLIIFAFVFLSLVALNALATGLQITQIEARVNYDDAYVYRLEQEQHMDRLTYALVPVSNGSKIDVAVFPGSNLTLAITVENTFHGTGHKLRNVVVTATIEGVNGGEDLEEKSIDFDLEPGEDYRDDIKFYIPLDIDSGMHNVKIEAEGEEIGRAHV